MSIIPSTVEVHADVIPSHQAMYLYREPMFKVTASVVLIVENNVAIVEGGEHEAWDYRFPMVTVRPGLETLQFAAVRAIKEQAGVLIRKDGLLPIDFRSDPERSREGNVIDIGWAYLADELNLDESLNKTPIDSGLHWRPVNFEGHCLQNAKSDTVFYMDHDILLSRAIDISLMMKD